MADFDTGNTSNVIRLICMVEKRDSHCLKSAIIWLVRLKDSTYTTIRVPSDTMITKTWQCLASHSPGAPVSDVQFIWDRRDGGTSSQC